MWGRGGSNDDDGGNNHDDRQIGPPMSAPEVPPFRIWDVTQRQGTWEHRRVVEAHEIEMAPEGTVVRWREFYKDEQGMPGNRISLTIFRPMDGWLEYTERKPVTPLLLTAGGVLLQ